MEELLKSALQEYKDQFGEAFDNEWDPTNEQELADHLRASKIEFETWRAKHRRVYSSLSTCALPLTNIGKVALDSTASGFPPASAVVGGLITLIKACEHVSESYDFLEQMFAKLEDALVRWQIDFKHDVDEYRKRRMQEIIFLVFSIITRSRRMIRKGGRIKGYFRALTFGQDEKTTELMENLEAALQFEDRTRATISLEKLNALWEKAVRTENAQVIERLLEPAYEHNARTYTEMVEEMVSGTGDWLADEPGYVDWTNGKLPLFLLLGGPGTGKTFVAASLVARLIQNYRQMNSGSSSDAIGYFFANKDVDLTTMLKSLVYQLQSGNPAYQEFLVEVFEQGDVYTARQIWKKLFLAYWANESNTAERLFLVIDGLDQMKEKDVDIFAGEMVREMLREGHATGKIHLCVCGRSSLMTSFEYMPAETFIRTEPEKSKSDMVTFIADQLSSLRSLQKASQELRQKYCDQILESCEGNFEWTQLLLNRCKDRGRNRIEALIKDPPQGLNDMIESCFNQIIASDEMDPDALRSLFMWLTYSKRPLTFGELYNAIAISTQDQHPLMWFHIVKNLSLLVRWRSVRFHRKIDDRKYDESLEELNEDDDSWSKELSTTVLMLRYVRIREYLISRSDPNTTGKGDEDGYLPSPSEAELEATRTCLQTLQDPRVLLPKFRFLSTYPATYMIQHLKNIDVGLIDESDKFSIADALVKLFYNDTGHQALIASVGEEEREGHQAFWRTWISTSENTELVQRWFKAALECKHTYDDVTKVWIEKSTTSVKTLLLPLAKSLQRAWLSVDFRPKNFEGLNEITRDIPFAATFVMIYEQMDEAGNLPVSFRSYSTIHLFSFSKEEILEVAQRTDLPQNANFCLALCGILGETGYGAWAMRYAELAFKQDPTNWVAAWYISSAKEVTDNSEDGLRWARIAAELIPRSASASIDAAIGSYMLRKHGSQHVSKALEEMERGYGADPSERTAVRKYLWCLCLTKDIKRILEVCKLSSKTVSQREGMPMLSYLSKDSEDGRSIWYTMGCTYRHCRSDEERSFVMELVDTATAHRIENRGEAEQIRWQTGLAYFYWAHVENGPAQARELLTKLMSRIKESKIILNQTVKEQLLVTVAGELLDLQYYEVIQQLQIRSDDVQHYIDEVGRLAKEVNDNVRAQPSNPEFHFAASKPALLHARLLRETSDNQEEQWKAVIGKVTRPYVNMLDDSDPGNDLWGLIYITLIFNWAGEGAAVRDIEEVLLLKMAHREQQQGLDTEAEQEPSSASGTQGSDTRQSIADLSLEERPAENTILKLDLEKDIYTNCQICSVRTLDKQTYYECSTCNSVYCASCLPTSPEHHLLGRACGSHHKIRPYWPVDLNNLGSGVIKVGEEYHLSAKWLEDFKQKWLSE